MKKWIVKLITEKNGKAAKYDLLIDENSGKILKKKPHKAKMDAYLVIKQHQQRIMQVSKSFPFGKLRHGSTAIPRPKLSSPLEAALGKKIITSVEKGKALDFGCGKSIDAKMLSNLGYDVIRYDPNFAPLTPSFHNYTKFDLILNIYVLNVVPPAEREIIAETLKTLLKKPNGILLVGVREDIEQINQAWTKYKDGYITDRGTFQTFFHPKENKGEERIQKLFPNMKVRRIESGLYLITWN